MMLLQALTAGFTLGIISSGHCIGMCGPIALTIPVKHFGKWKRTLAVAAYHFGRVVTYALLGIIFSGFGKAIYLAGFQRVFSVILGSTLLLTAFGIYSRNFSPLALFVYRMQLPVQRWMARWLGSSRMHAYLMLGMANGLLPCGMVYMALAAAATYSSVAQGTAFMFCYGLGTMPAMVAFAVCGTSINRRFRNFLKQTTPAFTIILGLLLIVRGLNLGIAYLSPLLPDAIKSMVYCY